MKKNKEFDLQELKTLVFGQSQATNNQKTKLFKLAKANNDIETIERLRDNCDFKSAKMYLDKLHNISKADIIKNRNNGKLKKITDNDLDEFQMPIEDLFQRKYAIPEEHYKDFSTIAGNMKIIITSPFDTTPELQTVEGVHHYQSKLSKLTYSELSIELSNVMAAKHNLMSFPTHGNEFREKQEKVTDLTDKAVAICIQKFGQDTIINYVDGDLSILNELVNTVDAELAQEVLNSEQHGSKMLDKINLVLTKNNENIDINKTNMHRDPVLNESFLLSSSFTVQCFNTVDKTITSPFIAKQFVLEELNAAYISDNDNARKWVKNSGYKELEYKDAMSKSFPEVEEGPQLMLRKILMPLMTDNNIDNSVIFKLTVNIVEKVMKKYFLGKYNNRQKGNENIQMKTNHKLGLQELKTLVFDKGEKNKSNKDRLFKLAKAEQDIATIVKMKNELGFKSAKIYLDKLDNLSLEDAIKNKDFDNFKRFVENGTDIYKIKTEDLINKKYDDAFLEVLIKKGSYTNIAHLVKKKYKIETIQLALENGADVNEKYDGYTGLVHAAQNSQKDIVELLLKFKADPNIQFLHGFNALIFLASTNDDNAEIAKLLLDNGTNINKQLSNGFTALIFAADSNNKKIVKLLLDYGADINIQTANKGTALILAVVKNNIEVAKLLLDHNADINIVDTHGVDALGMAASDKMRELLLQHGAHDTDNTPKLIKAFTDRDIEKIENFINQGDDIDQIFDGGTALGNASGTGDIELIELLLSYGADVNKLGHLGNTALMLASYYGQYEAVLFLLQNGADKNIKGYQGLTALDHALKQEHDNIISLLQTKEDINHKITTHYDMEEKMRRGVENDFKEVVANKVQELGRDGAKKYFDNLNSPEDIEKEVNNLQRDSTAFVARSLQRSDLTNEEMCTPISINSVKEYDGSCIYKELKGVPFQSIKTNIGYFLDMPHNLSIINPDTGNAFPKGIDWAQYIGTTFSLDQPILFMLFKDHIFLRVFNNEIHDFKPRSLHQQNPNEEPILLKEPINYEYSNDALYAEFFSQIGEDRVDDLEFYYKQNDQSIDVNKLRENNRTALMFASWRGNAKSVSLLLQWGADVNIQDQEGYTALMLAVDIGHYEICNELIQNGADVSITNYRGQNAMHFALKNMHPEIIELLENHNVEIESLEPLAVTEFEKDEAKKITSAITAELKNDRDSITEFLIYALNCNYSYELDLDYYINNNPNFLVMFKPGRDQKFSKNIVKLYKAVHDKYLDSLNVNDENKNNIRNKIYDLLMYEFQLGKYENCQFKEPETSNRVKEVLFIHEDNYKAELKIYDDHLMIDINDTATGEIKTFKYDKKNKKFENEDRGTIIITQKKIIEQDKSGGRQLWDYDKVQKADGSHDPKALASLLNKFSLDERLKYTNHSWDVDKFYGGKQLDYNTFMEYLKKGWDDINTDLKKSSSKLYENINNFLFSEDVEHTGFSSIQIKNALQQREKPENIFLEDGQTLQDKMNDFKGLIVVKQNDKRLKLMKIFIELKKQLKLSIKLNLNDLKEDKIDKFFTDVDRFKQGLKTILKDIEENADDHTKEVVVKAQEVDDVIEIRIIHKSSTSSKTARKLSETINDNGGNFKIIYDSFRSVCDWSIDTICQDEDKNGKNRYQIDYLYPEVENSKPHYRKIDDTIEGFTHILRFYK